VHETFPDSDLPVLHLYQHRAKSIDSLSKNLQNPKRYPGISLDEITDLAGARLIFYFEDDLKQFCQDKVRFSDWFGLLSMQTLKYIEGSRLPDGSRETPGYESYHFLVKVTNNTGFWRSLQDIDQQQLESLYCDVQLRTILRHGWAEAEHDLRYKIRNLSGFQFPEEKNRRFIQIAASIQAADQELVRSKTDLADLRKTLLMQPFLPGPAGWKYKDSPDYAYNVGSVRYDYQMLHSSLMSASSLKIEEVGNIFDIDHVMETMFSVKRYKDLMWETLRLKEPEFIATIDRDDLVVRVCGWDKTAGTIRVQPAHYSDQVLTNHKKAQSKEIPGDIKGRLVASLAFDDGGELLPFERSPLSNTLGVACMVRTAEQFWVVAHRTTAVAFDPGLWGCSASGALEWTELGHWTTRDFEGWFQGGMARECEEELGYKTSPTNFVYLGFARELGRIGKPQIFFLLDLPHIPAREIESMWSTYTPPPSADPSTRTEFKKLEFLDRKRALALVGNNQDDVNRIASGSGISEELRMNLALSLQRLGDI
jgi:ppGpp synthetase/RelA/SpoT-type nucleotidyltranferase